MVYHLFSYRHRHGAVLKVKLPRENPSVATLETLWSSANWMEREIFDLVGVNFEGHSDLRRILMPEDWPGYPLRNASVGTLIGRVGNSAPFVIGAATIPIPMPAEGRLYLGVNDDDYRDNSGTFWAAFFGAAIGSGALAKIHLAPIVMVAIAIGTIVAIVCCVRAAGSGTFRSASRCSARAPA